MITEHNRHAAQHRTRTPRHINTGTVDEQLGCLGAFPHFPTGFPWFWSHCTRFRPWRLFPHLQHGLDSRDPEALRSRQRTAHLKHCRNGCAENLLHRGIRQRTADPISFSRPSVIGQVAIMRSITIWITRPPSGALRWVNQFIYIGPFSACDIRALQSALLATRNGTRDHLMSAIFYSQMLRQLSYSRR